MKMALGYGGMALSLLFLLTTSQADTTYVAGTVSGTWTLAGSPYWALADCEVPYGQTLAIEPGVAVRFAGHYKLILHGTLTAVGTAQDSIWLTSSLPSLRWAGLRFDRTEGYSELAYCRIENGHAQGAVGQPDARGGGISVDSAAVDIRHCLILYNRADVKGGGIYLKNATGMVDSCTFVSNISRSDGGGLFAEYCTDLSVRHNLLTQNTADNGAGMHCVYAEGVISDNHFEINHANTMNGGGIYLEHSSLALERNVFIMNVAAGFYGAAIFCSNSSSPTIHYNDISGNNSGISCMNSSAPQIMNSNIVFNGGYGISAYGNSNPLGHSNIIYGNLVSFWVAPGSSIDMTYSDIQGGWSGQGNIDANPCFVPGISYNLLPYSPCIDAGNPLSPPDPDGTIADQGAHYFDQNQPQGTCTIQLTPFGAPIILPPSGGTVTYGLSILNSPDYYHLFDGWINLQQPDGQIIPLLLRSNLYLPPGGNLTRIVTLEINASAMPGSYTVTAYIGQFPNIIEDFDSFTFIKESTLGDAISSGSGTVTTSGWGEMETVALKSSALPQETKLLGNYPNPFNATTAISYELQAPGHVSLQIYDTAGRLVETLVNGWRSAGEHKLTFDALHLPSGMYFAKLEAEGYVGVQKLVLLK